MNLKRESRDAPGMLTVSAGSVRTPVIEVVSDIVCPWCFIGKRRLKKALAILDRPDVTIRWKPFPAQPDRSEGRLWTGKSTAFRKFGPLAYSHQLAAAGTDEGIESRFETDQADREHLGAI
jgi:predicted DsbA family dithiol-disulfide isomerase